MHTFVLFSILLAVSTEGCQQCPNPATLPAKNVCAANLLIHKGTCQQSCRIDPQIFSTSPFVLSVDGLEILYPLQNRVLTIDPGDTVQFACSQGQLQMNGKSFGRKTAKAKCASNTLFDINDKMYDWNNIECQNYAIAILNPGEPSSMCRKFARIGFLFHENFIEQMSICLDTNNQNTLYVHHQIMPQTNNRYLAPRSVFIEDPGFFNVGSGKVNNLYTQNIQKKTINRLLGVNANSNKYINKQTFFTRGHLAASGDFIYTAQRTATCRFINVAPQLAISNNKFWECIEKKTRNYSHDNNKTLEVWTGTYDQIALPDVKNAMIPLFLYMNKNTKGIPIPVWYWKIVYEPKQNLGVVILGRNDPYHSDLTSICTDVLDKITWMKCNKTVGVQTYLYACSIKDFSDVVPLPPGAPSPSTGLLV